MERIAIVGTGPTGLYTFFSLLKTASPLSIVLYEQAAEAGVGMPYNDKDNLRLMLANIASIEIPPLACTYLDWLRDQDAVSLARYGVGKAGLHERQFLPRILLGDYLRDQFLTLVARGRVAGFDIEVHEACRVADLEAREDGVLLRTDCQIAPQRFDIAVIATGHVWPDEDEATRCWVPSPWSGLLDTEIPACAVGILGTSLSAIDAAMAVAAQHGRFVRDGADEALRFARDAGSAALAITLMSRSGILPEADFYCPIPYEPLRIATPDAIAREIAIGADGLLDRVFALMAREIAAADPGWSARISLPDLDADGFAQAWFTDRRRRDPFRWAAYNLEDVERNRRARHTVPWRYAVLRLHEAVQDIVPHLTSADRTRFGAGLARIFVDNYTGVPPESIRRLLALRKAGVIRLIELGSDYGLDVRENGAIVTVAGTRHHYDVLIDARGQKPLGTRDLSFPGLRRQLLAAGKDRPAIGADYMLLAPDIARGRIAFGALPYLIHDRPFIQGITASARIGADIAKAVSRASARTPALP